MVVPIIRGVQCNSNKLYTIFFGSRNKATPCFIGKTRLYSDAVLIFRQQTVRIREIFIRLKAVRRKLYALRSANLTEALVFKRFSREQSHIVSR